ncbi:MAG TPA: hypothetical protein VK277_13330 [Acidimicrobiales bacterium]|nr:hypothetical protein [Acidimicrobiales bacterium]
MRTSRRECAESGLHTSKIVDAETGREVADEVEGEWVFRGYTVSRLASRSSSTSPRFSWLAAGKPNKLALRARLTS